MKKKNILVTGGSGFIGTRLVKCLLVNNNNVRVMGRSVKYNTSNDDIEYFCGDIANKWDVINACKDIEIVFHLAAAMHGDWNEHKTTTIGGVKNILDACVENGVKRIIYLSTLNVYDVLQGDGTNDITENSPYEVYPEKRGNYSHAKILAEKYLINNMPDNISLDIFHPGLVYGNSKYPFPIDVGKLFFNRIIVVLGLGFKNLPFVYIENLINALILSCNIKQIRKHRVNIYNLVDKDIITARKYIKVFSLITNHKYVNVYVPYTLILLFGHVYDFINSIINKKSYFSYKIHILMSKSSYSSENIEQDLQYVQKYNFDKAMSHFFGKPYSH